MNRSDSWIGAVLLLLALAVLWHVQSFPPAPGQPYSAALFPGIAAAGLGVTAILLIVRGLRAGRDADAASAGAVSTSPDESSGAEVVAPPAVPSRLLAILLTAGAILFYLFASEWLGFIPTGIILLSALMWAFGVRRARILPIAILATLLIHLSFFKLLRVPLPWGLLQPIAW